MRIITWFKKYFLGERIQILLRTYTLPQAIYSLIAALGGVPLFKFILWPLSLTISEMSTGEESRYVSGLVCMFILIPTIVTCFYFTLGKRTTRIFSFEDSRIGNRFFVSAGPVLLGAIASFAMLYHIVESKRHLSQINNINEIIDNVDSTDEYIIDKFYVAYGYYFYTHTLERVDRGTKRYHDYKTQLRTYFICPLLKDDYSQYDEKTNKYWVSFDYERDLPDGENSESYSVKAAIEDDISKLREEDTIYYFEEDKREITRDLLLWQLNGNQVHTKQSVILQARFDPYKSYNGYLGILILFFSWLGINLICFISTVFRDIKT